MATSAKRAGELVLSDPASQAPSYQRCASAKRQPSIELMYKYLTPGRPQVHKGLHG